MKKNLDLTIDEKRKLIDPAHSQLTIQRQCELLDLNRASYYYQPARESNYNEYLMRKLDELYTQYPFYGVRKITAVLQQQGELVNVKRIRRLLRQMGLEAIYPKPNLSKMTQNEVKRYPYLLRGLNIPTINHVWSTYITYIRLEQGFVYLVAIIDWYSRYILAWQISNTLDVNFCLDALDLALNQGTPQIFNTDQGSQFTSMSFRNALLNRSIQISWDGRGRALDNIFVEQFWCFLKYEEVYIKSYSSVTEASLGIGNYIDFYNNQRPHQSLNYLTPAQVHFG